MLTWILFLPALTALAVLCAPARLARVLALAGAGATCALSLALIPGFEASAALQWRDTAPWIPSIGSSYDVAVTGISLPLVVLTTILTLAALVYAARRTARSKRHAFLFLLMETGLLGVFCVQDLLLFYVFFEVGLVPMYFVIGMFGHENRRYAALKFFLYTRVAGLAILLGILALYLSIEPHSFSLVEIAGRASGSAGGALTGFAFFMLLTGFAIKLPAFPVHNWLPDAHVEAPAEGSAILAGLQLKMGGYGLVWVMLRALPAESAKYGWLLVVLALVAQVYGALAALAQSDIKRLIAFTSVNHMGYVLLGAGIWALAADPDVRSLAATGAVYQMVSHGLLTGAMFLMVGMLSEQTGTREMADYGGLFARTPIYAALFALLAFGSFGMPGMSGFVAELQVIGAALEVHPVVAGVAVLSVLITTGLYLRVIGSILLGRRPEGAPAVHRPPARRLLTAGVLAGLSVLLGVVPGPLIAAIAASGRALAGG